MQRTLRIARRVLIVIGAAIVAVLIAGFIIVRYYEDEVVAFALKKIEARLATKMNIAAAHLTLFKSFPMASVRLDDVYIEENSPEKDTLFFASSVLLQFNVSDLFTGNYTLREITVESGKAYLKMNAKGKDNWHFWKEAGSDTTSTHIKLESIHLFTTDFTFENSKAQFFIELFTDATSAEGDFENDQFTLDLDFDGMLRSLYSGSTEYASGRSLRVISDMKIDNKESHLAIHMAKLFVDDLPLALAGSVSYGTEYLVDLSIRAENVELKEMIARLPENIRAIASPYKASGSISLDTHISGEVSSSRNPDVTASFSLGHGAFKHLDSGVELGHINCTGKYTNVRGKIDLLELEDLSGDLEGGNIVLNGTLEELSSPKMNLNLQTTLDLDKMRQFFAWDTLETCEGKLVVNATVTGKMVYVPADSSYDWRAINASGKATLSESSLKIKDTQLEFADISGVFLMDGNRATVETLAAEINGNKLSLHGSLNNLLNYLFTDTATLSINAQAESPSVDFGKWIATDDHTSKNNEYHFSLPERIDFNFNTTMGEFVFGKFNATDIRGVVQLKDRYLVIDPISFNTAEGNFMSRFSFEQIAENMFLMRSTANITGINISRLFEEFDNFGQTFITDKNLQGKATATVQFSAPISTSLQIQREKISSLVDISIDDGRLIHLESLQQIATYIKKNKWVAPFVDEDRFAEKLKDIRFSRLENIIEISKSTITIPVMDIRSSAMDISARGTHTFDNRINYTIGFYLRDILVKKEKEWQEEDDRLGKQMFLYMRGTTESPDFGIDKGASKENRKEEMEEEKQNVKALLKEEFGLFQKDSGIGTFKEEPKPGSTLSIEWDELDPKQEPPPPPKTEKALPPKEETVKPKKKLPKWLQEKDEKEEDKFP